MADWTHLPKDLLELITQSLGTPLDLLRFRSVCSCWRSSASPNPRRLPNRFPIVGISDVTCSFYLSKRIVFLIGLPKSCVQTNPDGPAAWLVKIEEDVPNRMRLINPLSRKYFDPLPTDFPKVLDVSGFRVIELGQEFVLQYTNCRPSRNPYGDAGTLYMEKVVFMNRSIGNDDYVLLTIHISGKLAMLKSGNKQWTIIQEMPSPYDDVIIFRGNFYAVDNTGRTVVVDLCASVNLVAGSVFGGDKKSLVESGGELLLVDMYFSIDAEGDSGNGDDFLEQFDWYTGERTVMFRVFKLDFEGEKWVEEKNLGDRILFLGNDCTFSASVSDIAGCTGNCIFFEDKRWEEDGALKGLGISVFDLENGSIEPLQNHSGYSKLFWPPPDWVTSTTLEIQNHVEEMAL